MDKVFSKRMPVRERRLDGQIAGIGILILLVGVGVALIMMATSDKYFCSRPMTPEFAAQMGCK